MPLFSLGRIARGGGTLQEGVYHVVGVGGDEREMINAGSVTIAQDPNLDRS
jgi:hypothetical protein